MKDLVESEAMVERALGFALQNSSKDLAPVQEEMSRVRAGLQETQKQIDSIVATVMSGTVNETMASLLNERASALKLQRDGLRAEQRRLMLELTPLEERFDASVFRKTLCGFDELVAKAQPQEIQRMLRLMLRKVEWGSDGTYHLHFYSLPQSQSVKTKKSAFQSDSEIADWFDITHYTVLWLPGTLQFKTCDFEGNLLGNECNK